MTKKEMLKKLVGEAWYNLFESYLNSKAFSKLLKTLNNEYSNCIVYPDKQNIFNIFKLLPPEEVRTIIIAMDPYPGETCKDNLGNKIDSTPYANGCAFAVDENLSLPKSLQIIKNSITTEDNFDRTLLSWIKQGVFLYNSALTVRKKEPGSHTELWQTFTKEFLTNFSKNYFVPYLLWGKNAQKFEEFIVRGYVLKDVHPVATVYNKQLTFTGKFPELNNYFIQNNQLPIKLI